MGLVGWIHSTSTSYGICKLHFSVSQQRNTCFLAKGVHFFGPDAGLHFADMRFLKQQQTCARLPDASPYA